MFERLDGNSSSVRPPGAQIGVNPSASPHGVSTLLEIEKSVKLASSCEQHSTKAAASDRPSKAPGRLSGKRYCGRETLDLARQPLWKISGVFNPAADQLLFPWPNPLIRRGFRSARIPIELHCRILTQALVTEQQNRPVAYRSRTVRATPSLGSSASLPVDVETKLSAEPVGRPPIAAPRCGSRRKKTN